MISLHYGLLSRGAYVYIYVVLNRELLNVFSLFYVSFENLTGTYIRDICAINESTCTSNLPS